MRGKLKSALCGALCLATSGFAAPVDALAGPADLAGQASLRLPSPVDSVHYRRYHRRYYRSGYGYGYDPSGAIFAGAALGIMAAGVAAATQPRYYGYGPYYGYGYPGPYG
jgi:hypothetical protein